jgi:hypothetical protein
LRKNADERAENPDGQTEASRKVIVERIEFDRPTHLSESDVGQVIKTANEIGYNAGTSEWVDELGWIFTLGKAACSGGTSRSSMGIGTLHEIDEPMGQPKSFIYHINLRAN